MKTGKFKWETADYDVCFKCGAKLTKSNRRVISLFNPSDGTVMASAALCGGCEEAVKETVFSSYGGNES